MDESEWQESEWQQEGNEVHEEENLTGVGAVPHPPAGPPPKKSIPGGPPGKAGKKDKMDLLDYLGAKAPSKWRPESRELCFI